MNQSVEMEYDKRQEHATLFVEQRFEMDSCMSQASACRHFNESNDFDTLADFRLSLVGLGSSSRGSSSSGTTKFSDEHRDELHSSLYSSVLDTVRNSLIEYEPHISEEMISRAIIKAFADTRNDGRIFSYYEIEVVFQDQNQDEVDALWRTYDFMEKRKSANEKSNQRDTHTFLQAILDEIFLKIQREEITSADRALGTMSAVLSFLRLQSDRSINIRMDTILLQGLPNHTTRNDLLNQLSIFGSIKSVAVSSLNTSFGYCCFYDESSTRNALDHQRIVRIGDVCPTMIPLPLPNTEESCWMKTRTLPNYIKTRRKQGR